MNRLPEGLLVGCLLGVSEVPDEPLPVLAVYGVAVGLHDPDLGEGAVLCDVPVFLYHASIIALLSTKFNKSIKNVHENRKIR